MAETGMNEGREPVREEKKLGRYLATGFCILQLFMSGCVSAAIRHRTVNPARTTTTAPLPFSDYMRTIYRISEEGALESEEQRKRVLASNPELSSLAACVAANPAEIECRIRLAQGFVQQGLLWSAYTLFNEVLKINSDDFQSTLGLARIWDQWKDYSMARRFADSALAMDPTSAEAHEQMGSIHLHRGVPSEAVGELRKSLELSPANPVATANLGFALMLMRNWTEAKVSLQRALSLDSQLTEARNNLGIVLANLGDYDGAVAQMQQVGGSAAAYNNLGVVLLIYLKQPSAAAKAFEEALRYDPEYEKARENLAAARALMPPPTIVHLPPVKAPAQFIASAIADISQSALPIAELLTPDENTALSLPVERLPVEYTDNPSRSTSKEALAGASAVRVSRPLKTLAARRVDGSGPSMGGTDTAHRADEHIRIYELLGSFGVILMTVVISRRILYRMAVLQRCS